VGKREGFVIWNEKGKNVLLLRKRKKGKESLPLKKKENRSRAQHKGGKKKRKETFSYAGGIYLKKAFLEKKVTKRNSSNSKKRESEVTSHRKRGELA